MTDRAVKQLLSFIEMSSLYSLTIGRNYELPKPKAGCAWNSASTVKLCEILGRNFSIARLNLKDNEIGDTGAKALGNLLRNNFLLGEICLDSNLFT